MKIIVIITSIAILGFAAVIPFVAAFVGELFDEAMYGLE